MTRESDSVMLQAWLPISWPSVGSAAKEHGQATPLVQVDVYCAFKDTAYLFLANLFLALVCDVRTVTMIYCASTRVTRLVAGGSPRQQAG